MPVSNKNLKLTNLKINELEKAHQELYTLATKLYSTLINHEKTYRPGELLEKDLSKISISDLFEQIEGWYLYSECDIPNLTDYKDKIQNPEIEAICQTAIELIIALNSK